MLHVIYNTFAIKYFEVLHFTFRADVYMHTPSHHEGILENLTSFTDASTHTPHTNTPKVPRVVSLSLKSFAMFQKQHVIMQMLCAFINTGTFKSSFCEVNTNLACKQILSIIHWLGSRNGFEVKHLQVCQVFWETFATSSEGQNKSVICCNLRQVIPANQPWSFINHVWPEWINVSSEQ